MPPSLRDMADAYILAAVLAYSAAQATHFYSSLTLAALASIVLLINSHYLSAPIHPPSTALAVVLLLIPLYNTHASQAINSLASALQNTPHFVLEGVIALLLLACFLHLAILRPLANATQSRRSIRPIPIPPAPQSNPTTQSPTHPHPPPLHNPSTHHTPSHTPTQSSPSPAAPSTPSDSSSPPLRPHAAAIAAAGRAALQSPSSPSRPRQTPASPCANVRRRRPPTKSQLIATSIMQEREAQERRRKMAMEQRQAEIKARSEAAKAERLERERRRTELQEQVKEGARGVTTAREALAKAMTQANDGRMRRRRAADQAALIKSEENERLLDEACKESARLEMAEQMALNEVNAAQARWTDLKARLNEFDRS